MSEKTNSAWPHLFCNASRTFLPLHFSHNNYKTVYMPQWTSRHDHIILQTVFLILTSFCCLFRGGCVETMTTHRPRMMNCHWVSMSSLKAQMEPRASPWICQVSLKSSCEVWTTASTSIIINPRWIFSTQTVYPGECDIINKWKSLIYSRNWKSNFIWWIIHFVSDIEFCIILSQILMI